MPKTEIDYSNTIIYKITCKDTNVNDVYVGHTTNFVQRKHAHKQSCINIKSLNYKCKVYEVIRHNGGWDNWTMEIINFFNCIDHYAARQKEQEYFVLLNATLNSIEPMPKPKFTSIKVTEEKIKNTFYCEKCNIHCDTTKLFEIHNNTTKHKLMFSTEKTQKNISNYECNCCDFKCSKKGDWNRHIKRRKHIKLSICDEQVTIKTSKHICNLCEKEYTSRNGLWVHKKKCSKENVKTILNDDTKAHELIKYLLKENSEFKQLMIDQNKHMLEQNKNMLELAKNSGNVNINNTNSNNSFNLQFFLNDTCKDAMNITEFVNQLQVSISDLEETGRLGFSEGISKIFINSLKQMDIPDRPLHCSDVKRETIYIKDNNQWLKETDEKPLLINAIKHVSNKNMKQILEWKKEHPEYNNSNSKQNDKYLKIVCESMSGSTKEESDKNYDKIVKNIVKQTLINK